MQRRSVIRSLAVIGVTSLGLAACGGSTSKTTSTTTAATGGTTAPKTLAAVPGFDGTTIHLGVISPLTGPVAAIGLPLTGGGETFFKYVNSQGGIAGKYKVVLDEEDSQYTPALGVQDYNKLKASTLLIEQLLGTPVTKAVDPLLKQDGVIAAPASLDSDWVRDPNLIAVGAPYQVQMINAADYVVNTLGDKGKVFCSLVQDDSYGQAGQAGIDFAGSSLGYTMKTTAKYTVGATDLTAQIQQLKSNKCDVVFLVSTPDITGAAFTKAVQLQFAPQWVGQSPSYIGALAASPLAPYMEAHYIVVSEGPQWGDRTVKGMADMLDRLAQFDAAQKPDYFFAFGYYQAWAVDQILEKAVALGDLSHQGIMNAMAQVGTLKFDGLAGDYDYGTGAADRNPPRVNAIFKVDPTMPGGLSLAKAGISTALAQQFKFT
jgi:ABC-type branched-subunit amino acid transport system substrate-binding protein